ncbi:MAG: divalent-cation tolerance protein CutA [Burkholderiales bacterium]|nr:divalent-cation tolerance protein CutA [Burkholderiales bacterium]
MLEPNSFLLVLCNVPDKATAETLAEALVTSKLAACVNILPPATSIYRWQGKIEQAEEIPLLIKTTAARYADLEAAIDAIHPYEVPEVIAVPFAAALPAYLGWLSAETGGLSA